MRVQVFVLLFFFLLTFWRTKAQLSPLPHSALKASPKTSILPLKARGEHVPHNCACQAIGKACHTKGTKTWNFWNQRDGQKIFFKKPKQNPTKQTILCHMWELQSSSIYKVNRLEENIVLDQSLNLDRTKRDRCSIWNITQHRNFCTVSKNIKTTILENILTLS